MWMVFAFYGCFCYTNNVLRYLTREGHLKKVENLDGSTNDIKLKEGVGRSI